MGLGAHIWGADAKSAEITSAGRPVILRLLTLTARTESPHHATTIGHYGPRRPTADHARARRPRAFARVAVRQVIGNEKSASDLRRQGFPRALSVAHQKAFSRRRSEAGRIRVSVLRATAGRWCRRPVWCRWSRRSASPGWMRRCRRRRRRGARRARSTTRARCSPMPHSRSHAAGTAWRTSACCVRNRRCSGRWRPTRRSQVNTSAAAGPKALAAIRAARAQIRERVWMSAVPDGPAFDGTLTVDIDGVLVTAHRGRRALVRTDSALIPRAEPTSSSPGSPRGPPAVVLGRNDRHARGPPGRAERRPTPPRPADRQPPTVPAAPHHPPGPWKPAPARRGSRATDTPPEPPSPIRANSPSAS